MNPNLLNQRDMTALNIERDTTPQPVHARKARKPQSRTTTMTTERAGSSYNVVSNGKKNKDGFTKYKLSRFASEFSGTFVLIASIKLMLGQNKELAPLGIGFTLMMVVYNYGYNSLGMYNPAVTIAQIIRNSKTFHRNDYIQWTIYFIMQFSGGIAGGYFASIIGGKDVCMIHTFINPDAKIYEALFAEFFFCAILVSLNIHLATDKRVDGNQFYGIAIGTSLFVSVLCIGDITGSAINPAVWVGTVASAAYCADGKDNTLKLNNAWIYWVAHILAGLFYGLWFQLIYGCDEAFGDDDPNMNNNKINSSTSKKQRVRKETDLEEDDDDDSININDDRRVNNVVKDDDDDYHAGNDTELSPMHART